MHLFFADVQKVHRVGGVPGLNAVELPGVFARSAPAAGMRTASRLSAGTVLASYTDTARGGDRNNRGVDGYDHSGIHRGGPPSPASQRLGPRPLPCGRLRLGLLLQVNGRGW